MFVRNLAAIAGTLMLSASAALAQDANYNATAYTLDSEPVVVSAPRAHLESGPWFGPSNRATLSREVAFDDLNLSNPRDARELRQRVRATAHDVCDTLRDAYPGSLKPESCYTNALNGAMPRAEAAIREARYSARER